jgi:hypothetical protein
MSTAMPKRVFGAGIYYFKLHGAFGGDSFCARTQLTY